MKKLFVTGGCLLLLFAAATQVDAQSAYRRGGAAAKPAAKDTTVKPLRSEEHNV